MPLVDAVTWNAMIAAFSRSGASPIQENCALHLFWRMQAFVPISGTLFHAARLVHATYLSMPPICLLRVLFLSNALTVKISLIRTDRSCQLTCLFRHNELLKRKACMFFAVWVSLPPSWFASLVLLARFIIPPPWLPSLNPRTKPLFGVYNISGILIISSPWCTLSNFLNCFALSLFRYFATRLSHQNEMDTTWPNLLHFKQIARTRLHTQTCRSSHLFSICPGLLGQVQFNSYPCKLTTTRLHRVEIQLDGFSHLVAYCLKKLSFVGVYGESREPNPGCDRWRSYPIRQGRRLILVLGSQARVVRKKPFLSCTGLTVVSPWMLARDSETQVKNKGKIPYSQERESYSSGLTFLTTGNRTTKANMKEALIVLIKKVFHPNDLSQFWPISLCNVSYKIISKMLENRLKLILPDIIS